MTSSRLPTAGLLLLAALALTTVLSTDATSVNSPWEAVVGGFARVTDLVALSPTDIWAVGTNVIHYDGERWHSVDQREVGAGFKGLDMVAPGLGWAVGHEVAVAIRGGVAAGEVTLRGASLNDVILRDATAGWAVGAAGDDGVIYRLHNGQWTLAKAVTGSVLNALWSPDTGLAWAAGENGTVLWLDGDTWQTSPPVTGYTLRTVGGTGPTDVWAGGGRLADFNGAGGHGVLLHFDGQTWRVAHSWAGEALADMTFTQDVGYAVGVLGGLWKYQSGGWQHLSDRVQAWQYEPVTAISLAHGSTAPWVAVDDGSFYRVEQGEVLPANDIEDLTGIAFVRPGRGWAVGRGQSLGYNGMHWSVLAADSMLHQARDVDAVSTDLAWAVGEDGLILRWDGGEWHRVASPTSQTLTRVRAVSPTLAWALGSTEGRSYRSVILHYDGIAWSVVWDRSGGYEAVLFDVDGTSADAAWATGPHGVWRREGSSWILVRFGYRERKSAVAAVSPTSVWFARGGSMYHWDGQCWRGQLHLNAWITRMRVYGDGTGWAVGTNGYVLHLKDGQWRIVRGPADSLDYGVPRALYGLSLSRSHNRTQVWVAGAHQAILQSPAAEAAGRSPITPQPTPKIPPGPPLTPTPTATPDGSIPASICEPASVLHLPSALVRR